MSDNLIDRRHLIAGAGAAFGAALLPGSALAASGDMPAIRSAAEKGRDASVARLREWIANPSIAAENFKMKDGADYMAALARDAGFKNVAIIPTKGHPGVVGVMDNGAKRWVGVYFMYDVKQYDPKEWSSPPLEGRIIDKEGLGKAMVGRGAVNQKGPETAFLSALHAMRAAGKKPPVNIVLVCEGEEEIGSPHFREVVLHKSAAPLLKKSLGIIIPSAAQAKNGAVQINLGAKGIIELELVASGEKWGR
ncbi:MAG: M20/M25/M40 family metallo-hydrolase, partial [Parvularculaceae bacterium]|nr:M20/M25/M40 family metallo-hydrolase [Parvularculaceae bacterium]